MQSWYHALEWRGHTIPNQVALRTDDESYTYGELLAAVDGTAGAWAMVGVGAGDVVAVIARNSPEYLIEVLGLQRAGAIPALVNWRLKDQELAELFELFRPTAVFADRTCLDSVEGNSTLPTIRCTHDPVTRAGWHTIDRSAPPPPRPVEHLRSGQVFSILHTSGTTGRPKAIPITNRAHIAGNWAATVGIEYMGIGARHLRAMPLFHLSGLSGALLVFLTGGCLFLESEFRADRFVDQIERHAIEFTNGGPTVLRMVLEELKRRESPPDLSSLREIWYGNSPITSDLLDQLLEVFPCRFRQNYGMTESQSPVTQLGPDDHVVGGTKLGTAGQAFGGWEIRIVGSDDPNRNDTDVAPGVTGEILIRGENLFPGYWNNDEATEAVFDGPYSPSGLGWYRTGDLGFLDEDGYLTIVDRVKDMIISGGENVFPSEVENVLASHRSVAQVAIVGRPDELWGEAVTAVVVTAADTAPDPDDIMDFCREHLAHFKCPTAVVFVDDLPRNATGKVDKKVLKQTILPTANGRTS